jgi:uncharacterized protein (DUF305 family)
MQINIDKKTGILSGVITLLVGVIVFMLGSQNGSPDLFGMNHSAKVGENNVSNSNLLGSDAMFLEMMIPHHQQAVDISDLAIARSNDAELVAIAQKIGDGQAAEIIQMKTWLGDASAGSSMNQGMDHGMNHGMSNGMNHSMGDGMGGMLTESELTALNSLSGSQFEIYWLKGMITHHEGALHMVTMIQDSNRAEIRNFGEEIISVQTAEINQMKKMLNRMGA